MKKPILMTPGPTNAPDRYLALLGRDNIMHRTQPYYDATEKVEKLINYIVGNTDGRSVIYTSSGSGTFSGLFDNFFNEGDKVIMINIGHFSNLMINFARSYQIDVIELNYEWGTKADLASIEKAIIDNPGVKGIVSVFSETSTGALNDIKGIGALSHKYNLFYGIDAISGAIFNEIKMTEWHIDVVTLAAQKGFNVMPGIAFLSFSKRAYFDYFKKVKHVGMYFKIDRYFEWVEPDNLETALSRMPATSPVNIVRAITLFDEELRAKGLKNVLERQGRMYKTFNDALEKLGFVNVVKNPEDRSQTIIVVKHPNLDIQKFLKNLNDLGVIVGPTLGKWTGQGFRFGLIRETLDEEIPQIIEIVNQAYELTRNE